MNLKNILVSVSNGVKKKYTIKTNGKKSTLVLTHTVLNYLYSNGNQNILTGINGKYKAEIDLQFDSSTSRNLIGQSLTQAQYFGKDANDKFELGGGQYIDGVLATDRHTVIFERRDADATLTVNDKTIIRTGSSTSDVEFGLFATSGSGYTGKLKIFGAKFWVNNNLVRHYVPILTNQNRPCMYDIVNGTMNYNSTNVGEFLYG